MSTLTKKKVLKDSPFKDELREALKDTSLKALHTKNIINSCKPVYNTSLTA